MTGFKNIYAIYKPDYYSDLTALTNLAKRISGKRNIKIEYRSVGFIYTDGSYINIPDKFKDKIEISQGFIAHEGGHIGYGSFEISFTELIKVLSKKYFLPNSLIKKVINVVEDVRINTINKLKFPGFYRNLRDYTLKLIEEIKAKMRKTGDILLYLNLFMEEYTEFQQKPKFRSREMLDDDWKSIILSKKLLLKTLTPNVSIIVSDQLCKILKKYYRRKKIVYNRKPQNHSHKRYNCESEEKYAIRNEENIYVETEKFPDRKGAIDENLDSLKPYELEDPFYFENESNFISTFPINNGEDPFISQNEEFVQNEKSHKKSKLEEINQSTIEKVRNSDLSAEDIKELLKNTELFQNKDYSKIELNNISQDFQKDLSEKKEKEKFMNEDLDEKEVISKSWNEKRNEAPYLKIESDTIIKEMIELIEKQTTQMNERYIILEGYNSANQKMAISRDVIEKRIEDDDMRPIELTSYQIKKAQRNQINKMKKIFGDLTNKHLDFDNCQKKGRLNNKFIKTITSDFSFRKCFSRKIIQKELKILLMVDISGSMSGGNGKKLKCAKIAMIMLCEALNDIARLKIVLFTGDRDARNILVKEFNENINYKKLDLFGCHNTISSNLDGVSIEHEASKLNKKEIIIVISDGQPAGRDYHLNDAITEIHEVRKRFKIYAFSIDAKGEHLDKLYGKNWILTQSNDREDLSIKILKFCKIIVKEFFN